MAKSKLDAHNSPMIIDAATRQGAKARSPVPHATPRNQAIKLNGRSGFQRFIGWDPERPQHADGPDTVPYDPKAGTPIANSGGSYEPTVDGIVDPGEAVRAGFSLKPYTSK